jgi:chromosome segregation ATPase
MISLKQLEAKLASEGMKVRKLTAELKALKENGATNSGTTSTALAPRDEIMSDCKAAIKSRDSALVELQRSQSELEKLLRAVALERSCNLVLAQELTSASDERCTKAEKERDAALNAREAALQASVATALSVTEARAAAISARADAADAASKVLRMAGRSLHAAWSFRTFRTQHGLGNLGVFPLFPAHNVH